MIRLSPEGGNALHRLVTQRGGGARERRLAGALDMMDATIERDDQVAQVSDVARAVGVTGSFSRLLGPWGAWLALTHRLRCGL